MNKIKLLFILILGVVITTFFSCKKVGEIDDTKCESNSRHVNKEVYKNGDYTILEYNTKGEIILKTDYDISGDTKGYTNYYYSNKLLLKIKISYEESADIWQYKFTYSDDGKLLLGIAENSRHGGELYSFVYSGDKITEVRKETGSSIERFVYTYEGDIITSRKRFSRAGIFGDEEFMSTSVYEYDGKENPYHGIGLDIFVGVFDLRYMSKSNILKITTITNNSSADSSIVNYKYKYDSRNYPIERRMNSRWNGNDKSESILMEYD